MKKSITLLLPDAFTFFTEDPDNTAIAHFPGLKRLLSRANCNNKTPHDTPATIRTLFQGLRQDPIPAGALGALGCGLIEKENTSLIGRADPIACQWDHRAAYIIGNYHLPYTLEESNAIIEKIQQDASAEIHIKAGEAKEWYCFLSRPTRIHMHDLSNVIGQNMGTVLPSGPDAAYWHKILTEYQMLLKHTTPDIHSLWFWGIGRLPGALQTTFDAIYSNDAVIKGLGLCAQTIVDALPPAYEATCQKANNILIADTMFSTLAKHHLHEAWYARLQYYETHWFTPLLQAIHNKNLQKLVITCGNGKVWTVTKNTLYCFWKNCAVL